MNLNEGIKVGDKCRFVDSDGRRRSGLVIDVLKRGAKTTALRISSDDGGIVMRPPRAVHVPGRAKFTDTREET